MLQSLPQLALKVAEGLTARSWRLVTAESCTGGWIAKVITDVAGSSQWFEGGFVSYSNEFKQTQLGVDAVLLAEQGAVSLSVVEAMVTGALRRSRANIGLAVSGIAGPEGAVAGKPVGTVCFAWATAEPRQLWSDEQRFQGDREQVRLASVSHALQEVIRYIEE